MREKSSLGLRPAGAPEASFSATEHATAAQCFGQAAQPQPPWPLTTIDPLAVLWAKCNPDRACAFDMWVETNALEPRHGPTQRGADEGCGTLVANLVHVEANRGHGRGGAPLQQASELLGT